MTKRYRIKVRNIVMGVPITFLYKYNPNQFEIVSFRKGDNGEDLVFTREGENEFNSTFKSLYDIDSRSDQEQRRIDKWEAYIRENNNKKSLAGTFIDEPVDCFHVLLTNGVNKLKVDTKNIFKRLLIRWKDSKGDLIKEPIDCFHKNLKDIKGYDRGYVNKKRMYDRIFIRKNLDEES